MPETTKKYEITLKFEGEELKTIADVLNRGEKFGFKDPAEFIKFIILAFDKTIAKLVIDEPAGGKQTLH